MDISRHASVVSATLACFLCVGCSGRVVAIPSVISDDEYSVYAVWIAQHFKGQPLRLLIESRTFIFDPLDRLGCGRALKDKGTSMDRSCKRFTS